MRRLLAIVLWSVIAAAFIGPGTVTTCARAGSDFGFALAWALLFSTVACIVLQEAAGRITVLTGRELGTAIRDRWAVRSRTRWVAAVLAGGIVLGCAAYQAGNLLGAVAGVGLAVDVSPALLTIVCAAAAAALLATGSTRWIANVLATLVAVMGVAFLVTAARLAPDARELLAGLLVPGIPAGSTVLVLGLVGTTVVPYNLFLGSALARGARLGEMRWGLVLAVGGGGLISLGVLVVGTALGGGLEYQRLGAVLGERIGGGAEWSLAVGLFAAGFSSAITAPLAAAITARTLIGGAQRPQWSDRSPRFRAVWLGVLLFGTGFGLAGVQPIPVIILAQAFNGLLLPLAAVFLWLAMNDRSLLGEHGVNTLLQNVIMGAIVVICVALGLRGLVTAVSGALALLGG
ncbi:MAG TPA: Nramp family divalent metal transporter [Thermoanaerobaculales bacterium]|nr:Nramp family divalent metal transporter [Thermoanaerobaculales bacterium]HQN95172.1 Nramp family divalent metal transporter [Thermoanaerobaculales bacterium]HQP42745.1 Nramp family divalent metal transporter [Thermoanaerobaculales bacterium]